MSPGGELCHTNKVSIVGDGDYNLGRVTTPATSCICKGVVLSIDITLARYLLICSDGGTLTHLVYRWALFSSHGLLLYDPGLAIDIYDLDHFKVALYMYVNCCPRYSLKLEVVPLQTQRGIAAGSKVCSNEAVSLTNS
jgi:hypothetical protein